jgi:hypothetical protein
MFTGSLFFLLAFLEVVGGKDVGAGRKSIEVAGFRTQPKP